MEGIKISLLIPVFNAENYIERCVDSLFSQDFNNIEFIFVDDCSKDNSIEKILNRLTNYPGRVNQVKVLTNDVNLGSGATRRKALLAATGDYVMWVDSDDWLEKNSVISEFVKAAINNNADIVIGNHYYTTPARQIPHPVKFRNKQQYLYDTLVREPGCAVSLWNKLIKRELHLQFVPICGLNFGEDYAILPRLVAKSKKIVHISIYSYNYWQGNPNSYVKNISEQSFSDMVKAIEILQNFFNNPIYNLPEKTLVVARNRTKALLLNRLRGNLRNSAKNLWPEDKIVLNRKETDYWILYLTNYKLLFIIDGLFCILKKLK